MPKTERSITVSASYSRKVNLGNYESKDYWHSESREMPADSSQEQVDAMRQHLHKTVVDFVERQIAPQKPQQAPRQDSTSVGVSHLSEANRGTTSDSTGAPSTHTFAKGNSCSHNPDKVCYPCRQAFKNGAVPAKPKEVIPDGPNGEPWDDGKGNSKYGEPDDDAFQSKA